MDGQTILHQLGTNGNIMKRCKSDDFFVRICLPSKSLSGVATLGSPLSLGAMRALIGLVTRKFFHGEMGNEV